MSRALDGASFSNISATTAAFTLDGGKYGLDVTATFGGGSVQLQKLAADGATWANVGAAITANGVQTADVPAGSYRVAIATATAVYVNLRRIPGE